MDNAPPSEGGDCGFESRWARQVFIQGYAYMRSVVYAFCIVIGLGGCNRIVMQPNSLTPGADIYTSRGGYTMRAAAKTIMAERGYDVKIGRIRKTSHFVESEMFESETFFVPANARYILKVSESRDLFRPFWCAFNGFWWWRYNVSIVDQQVGKELLVWTGRNCANTSVRMFNDILDKLEKSE